MKNKNVSLVALAILAAVFGIVTASSAAGPVFYVGPVATDRTVCGTPYTFDVPGYTSVWLTQTKNGLQTYDGIYNVPSTYTGICNQDEGTYSTTVYSLINSARGNYIGSATFTITPKTTPTPFPSTPTPTPIPTFTPTPTPVTCSLSAYRSGYQIPNGGQITVGEQVIWKIYSNPFGYSAYWNGTKNGIQDVINSYSGYLSNTDWLTDPYPEGSQGSYTRYVSFKNSAGNVVCSTNTVSVSVVSTPPGTLSFSQTSFNFNYTQGGQIPPLQSLTFTNTSNVNIAYTLKVNNQPSWLNSGYATDPPGQLMTANANQSTISSIGASVAPAGLSPGTYTTAITVTGNFTTSPFNIPVTLAVASAPTPTPPAITLLTPNGGETIQAANSTGSGTTNNFQIFYRITNYQNLVSPVVDFELVQNGVTLGKIIGNLAGVYADQIYWNFSWQPGLNFGSSRTTSQYITGTGFKVKVLLYNNSGANLVASDESDGTFSIPTPPTPAPTPTPVPFFSQGPFETTSVTCGSTYTFAVKNYTASQVWLIQTKNTLISYNNTYNIPTTYTSVCGRDEGSYTNKVYSVVNGGIGNYLGSAVFEVKPIIPVSTPATITLTSSNGGETWKSGETHMITWNSTGLTTGSKIQIGLRDNRFDPNYASGEQTIAYSIDNSGNYSWVIPQQVMNGGGTNVYTIVVYVWGMTAISDSSNAPFSIVTTTQQPSVTVISPNGGENWYPGETHRISWMPNIINNVKIYIYDSSVSGSGSTNYITPNGNSVSGLQGYYDWTIPLLNQLPNGNGSTNYKIRIANSDTNIVLDSSDASFSITSSVPTGTPSFYRGPFKVTSAVCGESYVFTVDNYSNSAVWLVQTKNGQSRYNNVYTIPKTETSVCNQDEGIYNNQVYSVINGQRGNYLGAVNFEVKSIIPTSTPGTITAGLSAGTPYGATAKPGDTNVVFTNFTLTPTANEAYYIEKFSVKGNPLSNLTNNVKFVTISYLDKNSQPQKTSGAVTSQGIVNFDFFGSNRPYIPKGGSLGIGISADIRTKAEGAVTGSVFSIDLDPTVFKAISETSGNIITSINSQSGLNLTIVDPVVTPNQLQSNFLKNDSTAISIVNGLLTNYDIKKFSYVYGGQSVSTDNFAYRIVSAIRQLGYSQSLNTVGGLYPAEVLFNKFERLNSLPITNIVTKETLLKIDSMLVNSESLDNSLGQDFPLYSRIISAPLNEPAKEHLARIMDIDFRALPPNLAVWSENNFKTFAWNQLRGSLGPLPLDNNYKFCGSFYHGELGDDCEFRGNSIGVFNDDFDMANLFLHEYAHFLDANIYSKVSGTSSGLIDTTGFYNISFDASNEKIGSSGWKNYPYRRGLSSRASEFVSSYATGWQIGTGEDYFTAFDDFAESFDLYVQGGNVFRELGKSNSYLQQKYDWLKQNVFGGVEYNTGIAGNIQLLQNSPKGLYGNLVFNTLQYAKINEDHVFNYNYAKLGSNPTLTPTSTVIPTSTPTVTVTPVIPTKLYDISEIQDGDLIRAQGDIAVWIVKIVGEKRYKRWLFGPQIFTAYGHLGFNKVKNISKETLNRFDTSNLIRKFDDERVYELTDFVPGVRAVRRWIPSVEVFLQRGFDFDSIYIVNQNEFNLYTEGQQLPVSINEVSPNDSGSNLSANISEAMRRFLGLDPLR